MKHLLILSYTLLLTLWGAYRADAQKVHDLNLDFRTMKISDLEKLDSLEDGDLFRLVISSINTNLYKVGIDTRDTFIAQPLEIPGYSSFDLDGISKVIAGLGSFSIDIRGLFQDAISGQKENAFMDDSDQIKALINEAEQIQRLIIDQGSILSSHEYHLKKLARQIDSLKMEVYTFRLNAMRIEPKPEDFQMDKSLNEFARIRKELGNLDKNVQLDQQSFQDKLTEFNPNFRSKEEIKKGIGQVEQAYAALKGMTDTVYAVAKAEAVHGLLSQVVYLSNNQGHEYRSLPIQYNGDRKELTISITPRDPSYMLQSYNTKILIPRKRSEYFSVGAAFFGSTLFDRAYSSLENYINDTLSSFALVREKDQKAEIGFATLVRFGIKNEKSTLQGAHLTLGPGIAIGRTIKPRLLVGSGISFGRKHNFSLDAGLIFGYVDVLSRGVNLLEKYTEKPENVTVSQLKTGLFLSAGYFFRI